MKQSSRLEILRKKIFPLRPVKKIRVDHVLAWLKKKRTNITARTALVPIHALPDWTYDAKRGIVRHKRGTGYFFSVRGLLVTNAPGREVRQWNQPIIIQKEGGHLAMLCQEREGAIKFLLQARYEPGNIANIQLGPTIQATQSNLKRHHRGEKPRFHEWLYSPKATLIYQAKHSEEGARFWRKENINSLILLSPQEKIYLSRDDNFIWLTLPEIKALMLGDNSISPFVKTILAPL